MEIEGFGKAYSESDNFRIAPQRQIMGEEIDRVDRVKKAAVEFQDLIMATVPTGRDRSMAITHLEDAVHRAVKGITE